MSQIDYEQDRVQSVTQADAAKSLSDKVIKLKNLEDEILELKLRPSSEVEVLCSLKNKIAEKLNNN